MKSVILIVIFFLAQINAQHLEEFRAVKLTNVDSNVLFTDQNIADAMDYLASKGINVVLPVIWNGAWTLYPSQTMLTLFGREIHSNFTGRDPLRRVIIEAHRNGIEVYPWFEYGFAAWYSGGTPPFGGHILQKFPDWAARDSDGNIASENGFDWMSPIHPEVQDFMNSLIQEVIANYDVDGVEFSDRIPAMPIKGGYEPYTVQLYKDENNGQEPPTSMGSSSWKRWRADKLNLWFSGVREIVKSYDENIFVSSSPSVYPWAYDNYLQDAKTWIEEGIADHFIPQLYRYDYNSYLYELNSAVNLAGQNKDKLFAGILMNIGVGTNEYVIDTKYLLDAIAANRARGVMGEAYFYYEGFKKMNGFLADTLAATVYSQPAIVPDRGGNPRRIKAKIINEDDNDALKTGNWEYYQMKGFNGGILRTSDRNSYTSITYGFIVPVKAYYDIYIYSTPNTTWTKNAKYSLRGVDVLFNVNYDQSDLKSKGWVYLGTVEADSGYQTLLSLDNSNLEEGKYLVADAAMIMINRKKSPDVIITSVLDKKKTDGFPADFSLSQNYPNPFNPITKIKYSVPSINNENNSDKTKNTLTQKVSLIVYDILGREIAELVNENKIPGIYEVEFDASNLTSGVYIYTLKNGRTIQSRKMILIK